MYFVRFLDTFLSQFYRKLRLMKWGFLFSSTLAITLLRIIVSLGSEFGNLINAIIVLS